MEAQIKASLFQVANFVLTKACPCAFPRILYLMTFDPEEIGLPPMEIEFTQGLINQFAFTLRGHDPALKTVSDLGAGKKSLQCMTCKSQYECRLTAHGKNMNYTVMTMLANHGRQVGADIHLPMPIPGKMIANHPLSRDQEVLLFKTFVSANQDPHVFVEYMSNLK